MIDLIVRIIGHNELYNQVILKKKVMAMFTIRYVQGHVQVYDLAGKFLFSADSEREAREELRDYAESAA